MKIYNTTLSEYRAAPERFKKRAVADYLNIAESAVELSLSPLGKPFAVKLPVDFSVSHSGSFVVCAVSSRKTGIDIELVRDIQLRTARRFATEDELCYIFGKAPADEDYKSLAPDTLRRFFYIWTLKEAYFKCIGTGLASDMKSVSFSVSDSLCVTHKLRGFSFSLTTPEPSLVCAVCTALQIV